MSFSLTFSNVADWTLALCMVLFKHNRNNNNSHFIKIRLCQQIRTSSLYFVKVNFKIF